MGFFKRKKNPDCKKCGFFKTATSPYIPPVGDGGKGILIIGTQPNFDDDQYGKYGHSDEYSTMQSLLKTAGIDIEEDCHFMTTVSCYGDDELDKKHIDACRPNVYEFIKHNDIKLIIPMGKDAVASLYRERVDDINGSAQWRGKHIPDRKLNCWVCPIMDLDWYKDHSNDEQAELVWSEDLINAVEQLDKPLPPFPKTKVKLLLEYKELISVLDKIIAIQPEFIAYDYEANTFRPYHPNSKLLTMSMYVPELDTAYAFPLYWRKHFTRMEMRIILVKLRRIMTAKHTKFIAHNLSMEDSWTSEILGFFVENWFWDTMIMQHLLDVTPKSKGLKLQAFLRFGVEGYDDYSKKYITATDDSDDADAVSFNKLEEANLIKVLEYNALDSFYTWCLYEEQVEEFSFDIEGNEQRKFISELYNEVAVALSRSTQMGFKVNLEYFEQQKEGLLKQRADLESKIMSNPNVRAFKRKVGEDFKFTSADHLRIFFYDVMGYKAKKKTKGGSDSADHEALTNLEDEVAQHILSIRKIDKIVGTYIGGYTKLSVNGFVHPDFLLHVARTGRSCIAKGQLIDVVRDVSKYPDGIPIEQVKPGDLVYCYDDNLNLTIKKVLWAGKTGTREVCELHWQCHGGKTTGVLKATPCHRVRMANGKYVKIQDLDFTEFGDYRHRKNKSRAPKKRCLSLLRNKARLFATGKRVQDLEHRFIYETLFGSIGDDVIHHIDGNHYNNEVKNLQRMTLAEHSSHHNQYCNMTEERIKKRSAAIRSAHLYVKNPSKGKENYMFLSYGKLEFLKMLFASGGRPTQMGHDFQTMKNKANELGIDIPTVRNRFNSNGVYITRRILKECAHLSLREAAKILGVNYYKAEEQFKRIGVTFKKVNRGVKSNNHVLKKVVYTGEICDVYDLEVEDCHNFIASGLCVHNSSVSPNMQNVSKRDAMAKKVVRSGIIPPKGYHFGEVDYDTLEVKIFACYCKDPVLIKYLDDPHSDMHRDQAMKIFKLDDEWQITKTIRFEAKNGWVFALFYGSYWKSCARNIWEKIISQKDLILGRKKDKDGNSVGKEIHLREHLKKKGIKTQEDFAAHLKRCEESLWNLFSVTREYQQNAFKSALEKGYVESYSGFRRGGYIERGQIINTPVQGQGCQCLLDAYRLLWKQSRREGWKTYFAGQIHDSMLPMFHPTEIVHVLNSIHKTMCIDMVEKNDWLIVPMGVEASIAQVNDPWYNLIDFKLKDGVWVSAKGEEPIEDVLKLPKQRVF